MFSLIIDKHVQRLDFLQGFDSTVDIGRLDFILDR